MNDPNKPPRPAAHNIFIKPRELRQTAPPLPLTTRYPKDRDVQISLRDNPYAYTRDRIRHSLVRRDGYLEMQFIVSDDLMASVEDLRFPIELEKNAAYTSYQGVIDRMTGGMITRGERVTLDVLYDYLLYHDLIVRVDVINNNFLRVREIIGSVGREY